MRTLLDPFSFLVVSLAGWMNQHLQYGLLCSTQSGSEFHLRIDAPGLDRSESNRQQRGYKLVVPVSQSLWARNGGTNLQLAELTGFYGFNGGLQQRGGSQNSRQVIR